jgi:hypothetical protein
LRRVPKQVAPAIAQFSTFDLRLPASDAPDAVAAFVQDIGATLRVVESSKVVSERTAHLRMCRMGLLNLYLQKMNVGKYLEEKAPGVWEPVREGGRAKVPAKELLCYVALAMANGGRGLDHNGNVVVVGAWDARGGTLRAVATRTGALTRADAPAAPRAFCVAPQRRKAARWSTAAARGKKGPAPS